MKLPDVIQSEAELDERLTCPSDALVEAARHWRSPLVVLGGSGKMGPSLCVLAKRAAERAQHPLRVVAVSRFSETGTQGWLQSHGVATWPCDLLDRRATNSLPDSENLIYLVGLKFGTRDHPARTWAVNTLAPAHVAERYAKSRFVALSTGNVYPHVPVNSGGASEEMPPAPVGEYGAAALARERIFEHFSLTQGTPTVLLRLNYAVDLRYGVLLDIATRIWNQEPIDLGTAYFNCVWQGDANEMILRSLPFASCPATTYNLTGPETLSVEEIAMRFAERMQRPPRFTGERGTTALLSSPTRLLEKLGPPSTPLESIIKWTAAWVMSGKLTLGKPTHFEVRTGEY